MSANAEDPMSLAGISRQDNFLVRVVSASNLLAKDASGTSDPFVKLYMGKDKKSKMKTTIKKKTLDPVWAQDFWINQWPVESKLHVSVWDFDQLKKNSFLGEIFIELPTTPSGVTISETPLGASSRHRGEDVQGSVKLIIVDFDAKERNDIFEARCNEMQTELKRIKSEYDEKDKECQSMAAQVAKLKKITEASLEHKIEESNVRAEKLRQILGALRAAKEEKSRLKEKLTKAQEENRVLKLKVDTLEASQKGGGGGGGSGEAGDDVRSMGGDTAIASEAMSIAMERSQVKLEEALQRERRLKEIVDEQKAALSTDSKRIEALTSQVERLMAVKDENADKSLTEKYFETLESEAQLKSKLAEIKSAKSFERELKARLGKVEKEKIHLTMSREKLGATNQQLEKTIQVLKADLAASLKKQDQLKDQVEALRQEKEEAMKILEAQTCQKICKVQ